MPVSIALTIINYSKFEGKTACRGCKQLFPCYRKGSKVVPSLEYYMHCIEHCKEYRDRGWMKICSICNCKFLNNQALVQHKRGCFKWFICVKKKKWNYFLTILFFPSVKATIIVTFNFHFWQFQLHLAIWLTGWLF